MDRPSYPTEYPAYRSRERYEKTVASSSRRDEVPDEAPVVEGKIAAARRKLAGLIKGS